MKISLGQKLMCGSGCYFLWFDTRKVMRFHACMKKHFDPQNTEKQLFFLSFENHKCGAIHWGQKGCYELLRCKSKASKIKHWKIANIFH